MAQLGAYFFFRQALFRAQAELFFAVFQDPFQIGLVAAAEVILQEVHEFGLSHGSLPFRAALLQGRFVLLVVFGAVLPGGDGNGHDGDDDDEAQGRR